MDKAAVANMDKDVLKMNIGLMTTQVGMERKKISECVRE